MTELPTFREFVNKYKWVRLVSADAVAKRAMEIFRALKNKNAVQDTPINKKISEIIKENVPTNKKGNINVSWKSQKAKIAELLAGFNFYEFVDPSTVKRAAVEDNKVVAVEKNLNKPDIVMEKQEGPIKNKFDLNNVISDYNIAEPKVTTAEDLEKEKRAIRKKAVADARREIVDNFEKKYNEKSVEEQLKSTVTKIAKNKELMNLSKEQLRDYLRDAYEITDENDLNNMLNAVVAKRAELLANKQLKQEELTEFDISKLQEQSQRDFEKKLQDQNLRYILPAQIEKRERLVQNRLNPELLKGGY